MSALTVEYGPNGMSCKIVLVAAIILLSGGCARQTHAEDSGPVGAQLHGIAEALHGGLVVRIDTLHIPLDLETFGDISPQILQNGWHYKTTIRNLRLSSRDALAQALETAPARVDSGPLNLRQGVIFYSSSDEAPIGAIYFDKTGHHGAVNSTLVSFGTDLAARLKGILPLSLE